MSRTVLPRGSAIALAVVTTTAGCSGPPDSPAAGPTTVRVLVAAGVELPRPSGTEGLSPLEMARQRNRNLVEPTLVTATATATATQTISDPNPELLAAAVDVDADRLVLKLCARRIRNFSIAHRLAGRVELGRAKARVGRVDQCWAMSKDSPANGEGALSTQKQGMDQ